MNPIREMHPSSSPLNPQKKQRKRYTTSAPWNPGIHPTPPPCRCSKRSSWCPPRAPASAPRSPPRTRWQWSARRPRGPVPGGAPRRRRRWGDRRQDPPVTSYLGRNHGLMSGKTYVGNQGVYMGLYWFICHEMPQLHLMREIIKNASLECLVSEGYTATLAEPGEKQQLHYFSSSPTKRLAKREKHQ